MLPTPRDGSSSASFRPLSQDASRAEPAADTSDPDDDSDEKSERGGAAVPLPGHKIHKCTDKLWLVVFLMMLSCLGITWQYALANGDLRRLYHGSDYLGRTCGVDVEPSFVFWCARLNRTAGESPYERKHPICIDACPTEGSGTHLCFDGTTGQMVPHPDYATKTIGKFCAPITATGVDDVVSLVGRASWSGQVHFIAGQCVQARHILGAAALVSVVVGCCYLWLLERMPRAILYLSMMMFGGFPVCSGYFLVKAVLFEEQGSAVEVYRNLTVGCALVTVGTFMILVSWSAQRLLSKAVGCIRATCECIRQEPTLLLQPFIALGLRLFILLVLSYGFLLLLSCGAVGLHGVRKQFNYTMGEQFAIVFYCFTTVWLMGFCTALSQYTLAWVTQLWYFTPYIHGQKEDLPSCGILEGVFSAVVHHSGSLALGSLISLLGGWIYSLVHFLSIVTKHDICCAERLRPWMSTKNVYMDVALTSDRYARAASRSRRILQSQGAAVATLNGAQWVYFTTGYVSITAAGVLSCLLLLDRCSLCISAEYQGYADPFAVGFFATVICFFVAETFMTVFDVVGDTILYCFALDQDRKREVRDELLRSKREVQDQEPEGWIPWLIFGGTRCGSRDETTPDDIEGDVSYTPTAVRDLVSGFR